MFGKRIFVVHRRANKFKEPVAEVQAFILGGSGPRFSDKITCWIIPNFNENLSLHILMKIG